MEYQGWRYADTPTVEVATQVDAPPAAVWPYVADPELMPTMSDELRAVEWLDGATTAALGARFRGTSRHDALGEWSTTSVVVEYEPDRVFAWAVGDSAEPSAVWRFTLAPRDGGTRLTQWMQLGPGRSGLSLAIERMPDKEQKIVFVRLREFERAMTSTLDRIRSRVEGA